HLGPMPALSSRQGLRTGPQGKQRSAWTPRPRPTRLGVAEMNAKRAPGAGPRRPLAEVDAQPAASGNRLAGGQLLSAISTSIVGILREHYGRGPMKAKTYVLDDIIVVVMRGSGFTALEQTIMNSGEPDRVIAMREDFQRVMATQYRETIE